MASFLKDLRRAYPNMSIGIFAEIFEAHRDSDDLLERLDVAEKAATEEKESGERKMRELGERLSASEQHRLLHFAVPADVDLEHAQAIIMYGFLMPGQDTMFIGSKMLPEHHVRVNVRNKLGQRFSLAKFTMAFEYLKKEGVFKRYSGSGQDEAYSLKPNPENGISVHGAQILRVALEYARRKKAGKL